MVVGRDNVRVGKIIATQAQSERRNGVRGEAEERPAKRHQQRLENYCFGFVHGLSRPETGPPCPRFKSERQSRRARISRATDEAFVCSRRPWLSNRSFPPHPALSPGEREKLGPVHRPNARFSDR